MPAPKGHKRYGGRTVGQPNKQTRDLFAICEKHGVNIFESMVLELANVEDGMSKIMALEKIAAYLYPKRGHLQISAKDLSPEELDQLAAEKLKEIEQQGT